MKKTNVKNLLERLAVQENELQGKHFLAPAVRGGQVRTKLDGLLYTFKPQPADFEGWGIFSPHSETEARLVEEADAFQTAEFLQLFPALKVHLIFALRGNVWLAFPVNESDAKQRFFKKALEVEPFAVHLATEARAFETVVARNVGGIWFFDESDRRANPETGEVLRQSLANGVRVEDLNNKNLTPEIKICYQIASRRDEFLQERERRRLQLRQAGHAQNNDERRLREAVRFGGGELLDHADRGDYWVIDWTTRTGERHTSTIAKDFTVITAGICLSGEDEKFDLHSLVGVVEGWNEDW